MTDVPDLVRVAVVAPIGNSDHSSLSAVISMTLAVKNLCVSRKVLLKHQVNWNTVCGALPDLPWHNIWLADNPVEVLNVFLKHQVNWNTDCGAILVLPEHNNWFADNRFEVLPVPTG